MIYVVLDTNIYRKNPNLENLDFQTLKKLSKGNELKLYIPYIIMREFQTQQRDTYSKALDKVVSSLSTLSQKQLDKVFLDKLNNLKSEVKKESEGILNKAESQISDWADDIGAIIYPLCLKQAKDALEAYFKGEPPLETIKNRKDIPDSFIVQSIYKIKNSEIKKIHVVSGDKKVRDAFVNENTIKTYEELSEFIKTDSIQNKLKELDLIDNINLIFTSIEKYETESLKIRDFISTNVGDSLVWKTFSDPSIPDDNNEATINSYDEAENVEFNFAEIIYYGNSQFGIPFNAKIAVMADYYILKSDYYCMNPKIEQVPSVTDHNNHYFEAEEEFELYISGLVSISIDNVNPNNINPNEFIVEDSFNIDEIVKIELCYSSIQNKKF